MKSKISYAILLFLSIVIVSNNVFGQDSTQRKFGISFEINSTDAQFGSPERSTWMFRTHGNSKIYFGYEGAEGFISDKSFSASITPQLKIKRDLNAQIQFTYTDLNTQQSQTIYSYSNNDLDLREFASRQQKITLSPGLVWNFLSIKKLEIYTGISVIYSNYGNMNRIDYLEERSIQPDTLRYIYEEKYVWPGGYAVGIGTLSGLNFYLLKRLSIGTKFTTSFLYYNIGNGKATTTINQYDSYGLIYSSGTTSYPFFNEYKGWKFGPIISTFNLSFWI